MQSAMQTIDDFVKTTSQELGEDEESTRAATAGLLEALREQAEENDFAVLLGALPGSAALLHTASAETVEKNQHGLAGALGWLRGWAGGTSGEVGLLIALREAGFSVEKVGRFTAAFKRYAALYAGHHAVQRVFSGAPDLEILSQKGHA